MKSRMLAIGMCVMGVATVAWGHCQIPCGIYDDAARFTLLKEHVTTIEKSMKSIDALSADATKNANQKAIRRHGANRSI